MTRTLLMLCHHQVKFEEATEPVENRISYVKTNKPANEVETRLRWLAEIDAALLGGDFWERWDDYEAKRKPLYAEYWAKCNSLDADYEAKRKPLYADYEAKRKPLYAEYWAKRDVLMFEVCPELKIIWDKAIADGLPWDEEKYSLVFPEAKP